MDTPGSALERLDYRIQRWIWEKGWTSLRDAQERAVDPIMAADCDVIIAAQTAAGKTEAAFLPILTHITKDDPMGLAVYISPLKALINDQWGRLELLCESMEVPVTPWHGDAAQAKKRAFVKDPRGVLLITPESVEAMFVNRGSTVPSLLGECTHIVIDELHSFIGSDRGKQMQSLLHRIDLALGRRLPRVGLSATLGDMMMAAEYLRPGEAAGVTIIESTTSGQDLKIQVRGIQVRKTLSGAASSSKREISDVESAAKEVVADHLFSVTRGSNNLIFPNTRGNVEFYTDALAYRCEQEGIPNQYWAHHGSLSKEMREETERALKDGSRAASAVCTNTLELGIDIGPVRCVGQIGPPPSVAALRQRLGRSGRRAGEPAILRGYAIENEADADAPLSDGLREGLVQTIAMVQLLLRNWFEPPRSTGLHYSTLVQQVLSVIAQRGGATAKELNEVLVRRGAFGGLPPATLAALIRGMAGHDLVVQDPTGLLLPGATGETALQSRDFYAAFASEEEWQLVCDGKMLGVVPILNVLTIGQNLLFGGRRWRVEGISEQDHVINVKPSMGGKPPAFSAGKPSTHAKVREEMRAVLASSEPVRFLDETAAKLLEQARLKYKQLRLGERLVMPEGAALWLMTWSGDAQNDALALMLQRKGLSTVQNESIGVVVGGSKPSVIAAALRDIAGFDRAEMNELLKDAHNMIRGKWDWALPDEMLRDSFISSNLDLDGAKACAERLLGELGAMSDEGFLSGVHASAPHAARAPPGRPGQAETMDVDVPDEVSADELATRHRRYMESMDEPYKGTREREEFKKPRATHCWSCKTPLDSGQNLECVSCGWIICYCGACGCGRG